MALTLTDALNNNDTFGLSSGTKPNTLSLSSYVEESKPLDLSVLDQYKTFWLANNIAGGITGGTKAGTSGTTPLENWGNMLMLTAKDKASKDFQYGWGLKSVAAAGELFNSLLTFGTGMKTASMQAENTKLQADVQMKALDNQILDYKNKITDKFNTLIARNTVTMAAKNLRVSAGALLEQNKETAYEATEDIRTMESNAELKKIALRSQQRQADLTKRLQKSSLVANLVGSAANLGLTVATGYESGASFGKLYDTMFPKGTADALTSAGTGKLHSLEYEFYE